MNLDEQTRKDAIDDVATNLEHWRIRIDSRLDLFEQKLRENTDTTEGVQKQMQSVKADTGELIEILNSWKGAMKVMNFLGTLAKPLAAIGGLITAWFAWRHGK